MVEMIKDFPLEHFNPHSLNCSMHAQEKLWHYNKGTGPTTSHPSSKGEIQTQRKGITIHISLHVSQQVFFLMGLTEFTLYCHHMVSFGAAPLPSFL